MNAPVTIPDLTDLPVWSLDDLYLGRDDPRIAADLAAAGALAAALSTRAGTLAASRAEPAVLGARLAEMIADYQTLSDLIGGLGAYASLATSVGREDPAWPRFEADMRGKISAILSQTLFLTLEINALSAAEIDAALAAAPRAAAWGPWLRRVRAFSDHELSPELERLFNDRAPAIANWVRLYDDTLGQLVAKVGPERLTLPEVLNRLSDPLRARRKAAAQALAKALGEKQDIFVLCLNTIAAEKAIEDSWRHYPNPAAARHLSNEVDPQSVAAMETAVADSYGAISHRYYRLKAKVMGLRRLEYWDRNAPLDEAAPRLYGWDEAKEIVLDSFAALAPGLARRAAGFFAAPWIDARPRAGKQSGAYSHPVTAPRHPYVFLNYLGERRDVLTLAHELGHAVHQTLAAPRGSLLADTPLTLAETASIFAEGLVFERLLAEAEPKDRKALLAGKIEDALNTVVRQIAFHRFETRFHAARAQGEVSAEAIGRIWREVMAESLGPAVRLGPGYETYWAYVTHFAHAPFYVYAYAFGNLLVEALMEARANDPVAFAPLYEQLLAGGGARTYVEALAPFGLDPREPAFWRAGLRRIEALVDAFEALV
jgi:oligoendopeptidase F